MTDQQLSTIDALRMVMRSSGQEFRLDYQGDSDRPAVHEVRWSGFHVGFVDVEPGGALRWI